MTAFVICALLSLAAVHAFNPLPFASSRTPRMTCSGILVTWEQDMADEIRRAAESCESLPYMVAVVGIPGSGKTTSATILGELLQEQSIPTMVMPFDGYHLTMETLQGFPNSDEFIYRRGAPDTFNPQALQRDLDKIRNGNDQIVKVPGFDHARGDPEPDAHVFDRAAHKVVICEGLYLLHDQDGWAEICHRFDRSIFVNANVEMCVQRLKVRNKCIPGYTAEEIDLRCEKVDRANAMIVARSMTRADTIVESRVS
jgi:pantothenate kinase